MEHKMKVRINYTLPNGDMEKLVVHALNTNIVLAVVFTMGLLDLLSMTLGCHLIFMGWWVINVGIITVACFKEYKCWKRSIK